MKTRYESLDLLRGIAIIGMVLFHTLFDLCFIFGVNIPFFNVKVMLYWQSIVCIIFMLISGALSASSHKLLKRGLVIFAFGLLLSFISFIVFPEAFIAFGILHFFGLAMIITSLLKPFLNKVPNLFGLIVCLVGFIVTRFIYFGYILLPIFGRFVLPSDPYRTDFMFFMGFPYKGFISSDYYPMIPWYFMFLCGYFGFKIVTKKADKSYLHFRFKPMEFLGRHALVIYIIHQPIIFLICLGLFDKILRF